MLRSAPWHVRCPSVGPPLVSRRGVVRRKFVTIAAVAGLAVIAVNCGNSPNGAGSDILPLTGLVGPSATAVEARTGGSSKGGGKTGGGGSGTLQLVAVT